MSERQVYDVVQEPRAQVYTSLVNFASGSRLAALMVVRQPEWLSDPGKELLQELSPWLISKEDVAEWPGTVLLDGGKALLYRVQLGEGAEEILKRACTGLYDWVHPELPEDLCFLRNDGSPWLVSTAHEADAYFELDDNELVELTKHVPGIQIRAPETDPRA